MRIYESGAPGGYEWVVPKTDDDAEIFLDFDGSPRAAGWKPVQVELLREDEGQVFLPSDMPWFTNHAPVLKERAVEALGPIFSRVGELLPLACDDTDLWVFNATTVLDALDLEGSELVKFSSGRVMKVQSYAFRPDRLRTVPAFKVPQLLPGPLFVTEEIVDRAATLTGVEFKLLWEGQLEAA